MLCHGQQRTWECSCEVARVMKKFVHQIHTSDFIGLREGIPLVNARETLDVVPAHTTIVSVCAIESIEAHSQGGRPPGRKAHQSRHRVVSQCL